jgi:magnesium transporter
MIDDVEQKGILFSELDEDIFVEFIDGMEPDEVVAILEAMPNDDVADLLNQLPEETASGLLKRMKKEGSDEVEDLMRFEDDTAGGIMNPDFIALNQEITAKEAIEQHPEGVCRCGDALLSLRGGRIRQPRGRLLPAAAGGGQAPYPVESLHDHRRLSVQTDMDQEEVAKLVARYDILAVPVVDDSNRLVGIVTVDDVIDIFREEATEDILKMAGVGEEFVETKIILKSTRIRLPWLFASCLGGIVAFYVIGRFEDSLSRVTYLAAFIPVIMGMGGNIGTQSSTIVVRGLATGGSTSTTSGRWWARNWPWGLSWVWSTGC